MKKEYYKYEDIAVPIYKGNQFYFYLVKDKLYRINLSETLGIGRLPDGTFIIGDLLKRPDYMYHQIHDLFLKDEIMADTSLSDTEKEQQLNALYEKVRSRIKENNPDKTDEQIEVMFENNWKSVSSDYYMIEDITDKLNELMESYTKDKEWKEIADSWWGEKISALKSHFPPGGEGDLKVHPEYQKNMFIYDGEIIDYDAPANIVYGYVGNFINLTIGTLLFTGDVIQVFSNKGAKSDDERDQERIRQGYKKFTNQHS